jgi:hypothetical protein
MVEFGYMPRTGLAHERPSLVSLALIACFSLAVIVVAGWLVMIIMFSNDANTKSADPVAAAAPAAAAADLASDAAGVAALSGTSAPRAEGTVPSNAPPSAGALSPVMPAPADGAPNPAVSRPGDLLNFPPDYENTAPVVVLLPRPRPRLTAAVPVPRPRPAIDAQPVPPAAQQRSLFDILVGRQP